MRPRCGIDCGTAGSKTGTPCHTAAPARRPALTQPAASTPHGLRAAVAGAVGGLSTVAIVITLGVLALAPLGAATAGVTASFLTVTVSAAVYALAGRGALPVGGPTSALAVTAAALVGTLAASPARPSEPAGALAAVLGALGAAVMVMGLLQLLMAALRLGRVARLVPQPVLAGFMNGVALIIVLAQVPALLALAPGAWAAQGLAALHGAVPGALALGLGTAALAAWLGARHPNAPGALLALVLAVAAAAALAAAHGAAAWTGPNLPPLQAPHAATGPASALQQPAVLALVVAHPGVVLLGGVVMALVGALEGLMNLRAVDQMLHTRHDENRELAAMGLSNLVGGAMGALPMTMLRARAVSIERAGGHGRTAALGAVLLSVLLLVGAGPALAWVPEAALAGLMLVVAASLVDRWTPQMLRQWRVPARRAAVTPPLITMALVALSTAWAGPGAGVGLGVMLSTVVFLRQLRSHTVRWQGTALQRPSRRVYPPELEANLQPLRQRVTVIELEGTLFWGNAERVAERVEAEPEGCHTVVLDLRRVSGCDESAAVELAQLARRLSDRGTALALAGPPTPANGGRAWGEHIGQLAGTATLPSWPDADRAVEHAEHALLAEQAQAPDVLGRPVPLAACALLQGLPAAQQQRLAGALEPVRLGAGQRLFREGEAADALYVLTRGSVTVVAGDTTRYVSFSPGTALGELALLDGGGRSADAVADQDAELHRLTRAALAQLAADEPALAAELYRRIALQLAGRLRLASAAWREASA
jgi:SulP family sulfate permease